MLKSPLGVRGLRVVVEGIVKAGPLGMIIIATVSCNFSLHFGISYQDTHVMIVVSER